MNYRSLNKDRCRCRWKERERERRWSTDSQPLSWRFENFRIGIDFDFLMIHLILPDFSSVLKSLFLSYQSWIAFAKQKSTKNSKKIEEIKRAKKITKISVKNEIDEFNRDRSLGEDSSQRLCRTRIAFWLFLVRYYFLQWSWRSSVSNTVPSYVPDSPFLLNVRIRDAVLYADFVMVVLMLPQKIVSIVAIITKSVSTLPMNVPPTFQVV